MKVKKKAKKPNIKNKFIPDIKTIASQHPINKIDWPRSGCSIKRARIKDNIRKLKRYFILLFFIFFSVRTQVVKIKRF